MKQNNQNQTKRKLLKSTTLPTSGKLITSNEMYLLVGCNILIQRIWGGTNRYLSDFFVGIPTKPIHQQQNDHVTLIGPRKLYPSRTRQKGHRCGSDPLRTPEFWGHCRGCWVPLEQIMICFIPRNLQQDPLSGPLNLSI